jgi:hypothetical protein
VKNGQHHFDGGYFLLFVNVDGDAAAVVDYRDRVVEVNRHVNAIAVARQRLVDGVIYYLIDQVVKSQLHWSIRMYIAGRFRTASLPSSTVIEAAPIVFRSQISLLVCGFVVTFCSSYPLCLSRTRDRRSLSNARILLAFGRSGYRSLASPGRLEPGKPTRRSR